MNIKEFTEYKFIEFLTDNNALEEFLKECKDAAPTAFAATKWKYSNSKSYIIDAFPWYGSNSGVDYWTILNFKWIAEIEK